MSKPTLLKKGSLMPPEDNPDYKRVLDTWVPIEYVIEWFRSREGRTGVANRILVVKSETASGKSTVIPPTLLRDLVRPAIERNPDTPGIICTQPKVLTAIENVMEMFKYNDDRYLRLGINMGWNTKNYKVPLTVPGFTSATVGVLAQQLKVLTDEEIMAKYRYILIDETHERDLQTDMTIYRLKNLLERNANKVECPFVVLMSATFDPKPFLNYFGVTTANFIWCTGATAHIDERWDWNQGRIVNNYAQAAADITNDICRQNAEDKPEYADILIFMPGVFEFTETMKYLTKVNEGLAADGIPRFSPLQIDGQSVKRRDTNYMNTMYVPVTRHGIEGANRRVIITTNVAETGLTLPNLKYVIDSGYNREVEYNPIYGINALITKPAPQSRIKQRRGRGGRKLPGVFYPLYPRYIYDMLPAEQFPAIISGDISTIMLDIVQEQIRNKTMNRTSNPVFSCDDINMITIPTPDALFSGVEKLYTLGFISPEATMTQLGDVAVLFDGLQPEHTRMILAAYFWGASVLDMITIAVWLQTDARSFLERGVDEPDYTRIYRGGLPGFMSHDGMVARTRIFIADTFIDGLIIFYGIKYALNAESPRKAIETLTTWCKHCGLSMSACLEFVRDRDELIEHMIASGINPFVNAHNSLQRTTNDNIFDIVTRIKYCIYDGFRNNIIIRKNYDEYGMEISEIGGKTGDKTTVFKRFFTRGLEVRPIELIPPSGKKIATTSGYGYITEVAPYTTVYSGLGLKLNKATGIYEVVPDRISVMDGFVSTERDHDFAN